MGDPFVWHDVYADPGSIDNSLRQWRALSLAAPSLGLQVTGDATVDRYPFSVEPDQPPHRPETSGRYTRRLRGNRIWPSWIWIGTT